MKDEGTTRRGFLGTSALAAALVAAPDLKMVPIQDESLDEDGLASVSMSYSTMCDVGQPIVYVISGDIEYVGSDDRTAAQLLRAVTKRGRRVLKMWMASRGMVDRHLILADRAGNKHALVLAKGIKKKVDSGPGIDWIS